MREAQIPVYHGRKNRRFTWCKLRRRDLDSDEHRVSGRVASVTCLECAAKLRGLRR